MTTRRELLKTLVLGVAGGASMYGCAGNRTDSVSTAETEVPPDGARLTQTKALALADAYVTEKFKPDSGIELRFYPNRKAIYSPESKSWFVSYMRDPNRYFGDHFAIYVNDATGEITFHGGR